MAMMTTFAHSLIPRTSSGVVLNAGCADQDIFPTGLRVLVVDDDPVCLFILNGILRKCQYQVTTRGRATEALSMLRENRDSFDVIISDVHMPDMDGFKLLELVGLEMDLPVIMMSADGETSTVMKGIKHGACDYLLKPIRIEELRNIWQHVVRKKWRSSTQHSCHADDRGKEQLTGDGDHNDSANEGYDETWKQGKRRKDLKEEEEDGDLDLDDPSATKKPRVVWTVELHQQFVNAVNQLGIDKAVPKRMLELMNVSGLTRENVASHLQKYRLYMKKLSSGVMHQSAAMNPYFLASSNTNFGSVNAPALAYLGTNELTSRAVLLPPPPTLQGGGIGRLEHASSRPPLLSSYGQLVHKDQGLQRGPIPPLVSSMIASSGVPRDQVPGGLLLLQGQQMNTPCNLVGPGQLAGASNNVAQMNPDVIFLQALEQRQGGGQLMHKTCPALPLFSTDAGVWGASFSGFNGVDGGGNGMMQGQYGGGSPRLGTVPLSVGSCASQTGFVPTGRKLDLEGKGVYGLLGNMADGAQSGISTDAGVWGASMSHLNASCSVSGGISGQTDEFLGLGVIPTVVGASSGLALPGPVHETADIESSLQQVSGEPASSSGTSDILFPRLRGMEDTLFPPITEGLLQGLGPRFSLLPGLRQGSNIGQITQAALQGGDSSQEHKQPDSGALRSPSYGSDQNSSIGAGRKAQVKPRGVFKQQQEGLGLMGMERRGADGHVFNNTYVK